MRTFSAAMLVVGLSLFVLGCDRLKKAAEGVSKKPEAAPSTPGTGAKVTTKHGSFTVSKSTTFVTGPIDSTGHIDYAGALNERLSKGVTAENNANVAIWKVIGPNPSDGAKIPPGYFEKLGMQPPPATGDYFIGLKQYTRQKGGHPDAMSDSLKRLGEQPWTASQDAMLNGWLLANHKPLTALREAVKKPQYFSPVIPEQSAQGSKGLYASPLPGPMACREFAGAFAARAMLFLGNNQPSEAWQDLLACHRLGRLAGRGGALIEAVVGMAIEQIACRADVAFLEFAKPDARTIQACMKDLRVLPSFSDVTEKIDACERMMFLDFFMQMNLQGIGYLNSLAAQDGGAGSIVNVPLEGIDWDGGLENANMWYDRLVAAARGKDRADRAQKFNQLTADLNALRDRASEPGRVAQMLRDGNASPKAKGEAICDVFVTRVMPAAPKVMDASDRTSQTHENVITAFALAWYQRFNGRYPAKLAELVPTYLTQTPTDIFSRDLIYQPNANGFLLYSVGINGIDDGGKGYTDNPKGDDLVVRIPHAAKP